MNFPSQIDDRDKPAGARSLLLAVAVVALAFFLAEHNHDLPLKDLLDPDSANVELAASEGSIPRRIGFGLLLLGGLGCLIAARRRPFRIRGTLGIALVAYCGWSVASMGWSADVPLTLRRVSVFACFTVGACGLGRLFTLRQLCVIGTSVAGLYLLIGFGDELYQGFFQPGSADYRFTGHVHPNLQASFCAVMCLGALCLMDRPGRLRMVLAALAALAFLFLLLTKSRTSVIALFAGCAVIAAQRLSARQRLAVGLCAAWLVGTAVLAASIGGFDVPQIAERTLLINRTDDAISLTGRVPLWEHLIGIVDDRILIGFGYGSFWTPQHIHSASAVVGTGISHAHCAYLEIVLNLGLVGLATYLIAIGAGLRGALAGCRASAEAGMLFLASLLAFAVVHAVSEAMFVTSSFVPFVAACGMWNLALRAADSRVPVAARCALMPESTDNDSPLAGGAAL